jgi:hypothetical protein
VSVGDKVAFRWNGRLVREAKLVGVYDFKSARKVEDRNGLEYIVESKDVLDECELERQAKVATDAKNLEEYGDIVDAWMDGKRTNAELAEATNTPINGIASRLRAARRRGLLK